MRDGASPTSEPSIGFWRRQFSGDETSGQWHFDLVAGVTLPVICLAVDPIVFRSMVWFAGLGLLAEFRVLGYLAVLLGSVVIGLDRRFRVTGLPAAFLGDVFWGAGLMALMFSVILLPFSIIGLLALIGAFGLLPWLTAFTYLRRGVRAAAKAKPRKVGQWAMLALGVLLFWALTYGPQLWLIRLRAASIEAVAAGTERQRKDAIRTLRRIRHLTPLSALVWTYEKEPDPNRKGYLASAYYEITGMSVDQALWRLRD